MNEYMVPNLKEHSAILVATRQQLLRRAKIACCAEVTAVLLFIVYLIAIYTLSQEWPVALQQISSYAWYAMMCVLGIIGCVPLGIALGCELYRENVMLRVTLSEARLDVVASVHAAIAEYFGDNLAEYSNHLKGFGLAEELLKISDQMSARFDRTFQTVEQAIQSLDQHRGLTGIKHETLKAEILNTCLQELLDALTGHDLLEDAQTKDEQLSNIVVDFEKHIRDLR